jgi:guanylate kinase
MAISDRIKQKVAAYQPDKDRLAELNHMRIVLLSATSGTGKDSILHYLLSTYPDEYYQVVSHTTRQPRRNNGVLEQDGIDYHFINFEQAESLLDTKAYVEANIYNNNIYGTTVTEFEKANAQGKTAITEVEVNGSDDFIALVPSVKTIFIVPPSFEEWRRRLMNRYGDDTDQYSEDIRGRMEIAEYELENVLASDHFYLIINDTLEHGGEKIRAIATDPTIPLHTLDTLATAKEMLAKLRESL